MNDDKDFRLGVFLGFIIGAVCCCVIGCFAVAVVESDGIQQGITATRQQATEAGVAEYVCDPKTGERCFRWITQEKGE